MLPEDTTQDEIVGLLGEWDGSEKYNRVCRIGKGAFATVYKVTSKFDGKPYAAKELDKRKFMKNGVLDQKVENEMKIMQRAKHVSFVVLECPLFLCLLFFSLSCSCVLKTDPTKRNIVEYIEHMDHDDRLFIIIMEYVPHGDLGDLVSQNGPLMEGAVQNMSSQLLSALAYLHRHSITHRDVKPDNILVYSMKPFIVKLTDFGLSKMADPNKTFLKTFCGTLLYCAPEVYNEFAQYDEYNHRFTRTKPRRKTLGQRYDHAVDIWSLGGVIYYTLTGSPPFPAKNGISYTELLHQIMTKPLNTGPLQEWKISSDGIDCLKSMLQRRPQKRATTDVLQVHPWLKDTDFARERDGDSQGSQGSEIDDELGLLGKEASQLSLEDKSSAEDVLAEEKDDGLEYDTEHGDNRDSEQFLDENIHITDFDRFDSHHKENYTFGQMPMRPQRLFGEVSDDDSAADTPDRSLSQSGESVLPATEVSYDHASMAALTFNRTQIYNPQPQQSSDQPAPRQQQQQQGRTSIEAQDFEAQDLEGTESQLENLNMKSLAATNANFNSFTTNKRKPSQEASEEVNSTPRARPAVKRIRSESVHEAVSSDEEAEQNLYSQIPALARNASARQIDKPVHKTTYWDAHDRRTWHLHYPEMTQIQHDVFASAAKKRGEDFLPGKTPLWDLAMKHFPPAVPSPQLQSAESGTSGSDLSSRASDWRSDEFSRGTTAPWLRSVDDDLPGTMSPGHSSFALAFTDAPFNRIVASLDSAEGSVLPGISISIDSAMVSWGRERVNTHIFTPSAETKVPKYGFKILLWKEGFQPSRNFRPWNLPDDDFHFYISTKATHGIFVNDMALASFEPENPKGSSQNWVRLYDGDMIVPWRGNDRMMIKLKFNCSWGGSARSRPVDSPVALVPAEFASHLDASCRKAEAGLAKLAEKDKCQREADFDASERLRNIDRERLRSQMFEAKRLEACRAKTMRASRRSSPAHIFPPSSAPPNMMAFGNGAMARQQNVPTLQHAASVVDTRALRTMLDE